MALHGTLEVNSEQIGYWQARLTAQRPEGEASTYECVVTCDRMMWEGHVQHDRGHGAVVLAARVLAASGL